MTRITRPLAIAFLTALSLSAAAPASAGEWTPVGGGWAPSSTRRNLGCGNHEALVGVFGRAGDYIDRIGAICQPVDALGRWTGASRTTGTVGGTGGTPFQRLCPRDHAVSGFRGRGGMYVDELGIRCRPLGDAFDLVGTGTWLDTVSSGRGGTAFGPFHCPEGTMARVLRAEGGWFVDRIRVFCEYLLPTAAAPVSPANGATSTTLRPTFTWNAPQLAESSTFCITGVGHSYGPFCQEVGSATSYTYPSNLPYDTGALLAYRWWIETCNERGCTNESGTTGAYLMVEAPRFRFPYSYRSFSR